MATTPTFQPKKWLTAVMVGNTPSQHPSSEEEWKTLLETAATNRIIPLCHHQIAENPIKKQCPDWFCEALKTHTLSIAASEMAQSHELVLVLDEFARKGIHPFLMKGSALAYSLYPQPYLRERCDTDMLIPVKDIDAVFNVMENIGYQYHRVDDLLTRQISFSKKGPASVPNVLDIHWRINNRPLFQNTLTYSEIKQDCVKIPGVGDNAFTLSLVHSLILACLHRVAEGAFGENENLLWLYDIHLLLGQMTEAEYETFIEQGEKKQIRMICMDALDQSKELFNTDVPAWVKAALSKDCATEISARLLEPGAPRYKLSDLSRAPGIRNKWRGVLEALFPPPSYLMHYEQSRNKILLLAYYARRIIRGLLSA